VVSAATTAAALYLTRDGDAPLPVHTTDTPSPIHTGGIVQLDISPPTPRSPSTASRSFRLAAHRPHRRRPPDRDRSRRLPGWLTSIELVAGQTHPLNVSLEPLGSAVPAEATLLLGSSPAASRSSSTAPLSASPRQAIEHRQALAGHRPPPSRPPRQRRRGLDQGHRRSPTTYEFHPQIASLAPSAAPADPASPTPTAAPTPSRPRRPRRRRPRLRPRADRTAGRPCPRRSSFASPRTVPHRPPAPPSTQPPIPQSTPSTNTVTISSTAVTRLSGAPPRVTALPNAEIPPEVTAKLCLDETGHISSAEILTPLDPGIATEIVEVLRTWIYAPYTVDGTARAACFPLTFRSSSLSDAGQRIPQIPCDGHFRKRR